MATILLLSHASSWICFSLHSAFRTMTLSPAWARAELLSQEYPPVNRGAGKLYAGACKSCSQQAGQQVGYVINCADVSCQGHPFCVRLWLNNGYDGTPEEWAWQERIAALVFGENVLLHCRQGKHRSGAFCILMLALLMGSPTAARLGRA